MRVCVCAALALATAACHDPATPTAAQVETARHSELVRITAGNPQAPPNLAELIALGRNVKAEQSAKGNAPR